MYDLDLVTNDSKYLLSQLYAEYIKRRNNKESKQKSIYFQNADYIHKTFMNDWTLDDVIYSCLELRKKGFLNGQPASNSLMNISLSSEAIALLEEDFSDKLDKVLEWGAKIKSSIPFI